MLDQLDHARWRVIHDATLGRGNVDHIAIGPPGVFTIETKSHPGPIRVGRVHGAMLAQAQAQGKAIGWVTGTEVEPLIVFSRAWVDRPGARRKGVRVLPARMLLSHLEHGQMRMSSSDVDQAHRLLAEALLEHHGRHAAARGSLDDPPVAPPSRGMRGRCAKARASRPKPALAWGAHDERI